MYIYIYIYKYIYMYVCMYLKICLRTSISVLKLSRDQERYKFDQAYHYKAITVTQHRL